MSVQMRVNLPAIATSSAAPSNPVPRQNLLKRIWNCFVTFLSNLCNSLKNCISSWFRTQPKVLPTPVEKAQARLREGFNELQKNGALMPCKAAVIFKQGRRIIKEHAEEIDAKSLEKFCKAVFSNPSVLFTSLEVILLEKHKPIANLTEGNADPKTVRRYAFLGGKSLTSKYEGLSNYDVGSYLAPLCTVKAAQFFMG